MNAILKKKNTLQVRLIVSQLTYAGRTITYFQKNNWHQGVISNSPFIKSLLYKNAKSISVRLSVHKDFKNLYARNTSISSGVAYARIDQYPNPNSNCE